MSGCQSQVQIKSSKVEKQITVAKQFIEALYKDDNNAVKYLFDSLVIKAAKTEDEILQAILETKNQIKKEYGENLPVIEYITSEQTTIESKASIYLILKLETPKLFGYYNFFISNESNKVLLVQEYSNVLDKTN